MRGRRSLISLREIHEMKQILVNEGLEGRVFTWQYLGFEKTTIQCTMDMIDYYKCLACKRGWPSPKNAAHFKIRKSYTLEASRV